MISVKGRGQRVQSGERRAESGEKKYLSQITLISQIKNY